MSLVKYEKASAALQEVREALLQTRNVNERLGFVHYFFAVIAR